MNFSEIITHESILRTNKLLPRFFSSKPMDWTILGIW